MVKIVYNKLVRDRIPEIVEGRGASCEVRKLTKEEYEQCLKVKLEEEVAELAAASTLDDRIAEIADIYEVLEGIMDLYGVSLEAVWEVKSQKKQSRGAFKERVFLESVDELG